MSQQDKTLMYSELNYAEILVYNKHGKIVGKFSNSTSKQSSKNKKNMLSSPTVHNIVNGESTLSFEMLASSKKWAQVNDVENEWHCDGRVYVMFGEDNVSYSDLKVNVTLYEKWILLNKQFGQIHNIEEDIESVDIHTVIILPKSKGKLTVNGIQYEDSEVRDSRGIVMPRGSAGYALWAILKANSQGWSIGVCDMIVDGFDVSVDYGSFNLESDKTSLLENIMHIQSTWGGILVWDSYNMTVSLRDEEKESSDFNAFKGFIAREGKNLLSYPKMKVDNDIATRVYPLGNGDIHIKEVNDGKMYLEDFTYVDKIYEKYITNENIHYSGSEDLTGQRQLKFWAEQQIKKLRKPRITYLIDIFDRSNELAYQHEKFKIADIIKLIFSDPFTGEEKEIQERIIDISYDVWNRSSTSVAIGDRILNNVEVWKYVFKSATEDSATKDWNGDLNGNDIKIEIPSDWSSYFGGGGYASLAVVTELFAQKTTENTDAVAAVKVYADETFASVESFTTFKAQTEQGFSQSQTSINQISNTLSAQITLEAKHYSETVNSINSINGQINTVVSSVANLKIYADNTFAQVTSFTEFQQQTQNSFSQSQTSINQISNTLSAQITLEARHYSELNNSINNVNNYVASIKVEADSNKSQISAQATKISNLENSTSRINSTASSGSYLNLTSTIANLTFVAGSYSSASIRLGPGATLSLFATTRMDIGTSSSTIYLLGKKIKFNSSGYLVEA